ncbi:MAG TPA: hypothetical protein VJ945_06795 [Flavobacteriaceae bacterium]|nr:hypothetical protein [Flavobacteriaceae bacterium]
MSESFKLPENYFRSISSKMYLIEKSIIETEDLLLRKSNGSCFEIVDDLEESEIEFVLQKISVLKALIEKLALKYNLRKNISYTSRILQAKNSKIWEILGDSFSNRLKGYGKLSGEITDELDSDLSSMMEIIEQLLDRNNKK